MRAFLAFKLVPEIRDYLTSVIKHLSRGIDGVRWVRPEGLHVTLKFFGDITDDRRREIEVSLDGIEGSHRAAGVALKAIDAFPNMRRPRVIVAGLEDGVDIVKAIFHDIEERLAIIGIEKEVRGFIPHITLGRVKSPVALPEKALGPLEKQRFSLDTLVLYESVLTRQGALYTPLKEIKFNI